MFSIPHFRHKINNRLDWLERAILAIDRRQTDDEQADRTTKYRNARGWNANDARSGTKYAKAIRDCGFLPFIYVNDARRIIMKYAGQLVIVAKERASKAA